MGSLLDAEVGPDALVVTVAGTPLSLEHVGPITIRHGRPQLDTLPVASVCSLTCHASELPALPVIGDLVTVELGPDALAHFGLAGDAADAARWRFRGTVTDPATQLAQTTRPGVVSLTAVSRRSRLGTVPVGDAPWPLERDGDRAAHILAALPAGLVTVGDVDPGTVDVLARDVDRQMAGPLLDQLALDTGGVLAQLRDGTLEWHDAEHRRGSVASVTFDASDLMAPATWAQHLGGTVNDLTVGYGPEPQATVRIVDSLSADPVDGIGPMADSIGTQLATLADATSMANLTVGRRSVPRYVLDALTVDLLRTLVPATAAALLQLEFGALLALTGMPAGGPLSTGRLWLEGWTETITRTSWRSVLLVSAYGQSGPPVRWVDVPISQSWAAVDPGLSWLGATSWDLPSLSLGRWVDMAASVEWADLVPESTYATS